MHRGVHKELCTSSCWMSRLTVLMSGIRGANACDHGRMCETPLALPNKGEKHENLRAYAICRNYDKSLQALRTDRPPRVRREYRFCTEASHRREDLKLNIAILVPDLKMLGC